MTVSDGDTRAVPWPSDALLGGDGKVHVTTPLPFDSNVEDNLTSWPLAVDGRRLRHDALDLLPGQRRSRRRRRRHGDRRRPRRPVQGAGSRSSIASTPSSSSPSRPSARRSYEHHPYGCFVAGGVHDTSGPALHPSSGMRKRSAAAAVGARASYASWPRCRRRAASRPQAATAFTTQTLSAWAKKAQADLPRCRPRPPSIPRSRRSRSSTTSSAGRRRPPSRAIRRRAASCTPTSPPSSSAISMRRTICRRRRAARRVRRGDDGQGDRSHSVHPHSADPQQQRVDADRHLPARHQRRSLGALTVANSSRRAASRRSASTSCGTARACPAPSTKVCNLSGTPGPDGIGDPTASGAVQYFFDFSATRPRHRARRSALHPRQLPPGRRST